MLVFEVSFLDLLSFPTSVVLSFWHGLRFFLSALMYLVRIVCAKELVAVYASTSWTIWLARYRLTAPYLWGLAPSMVIMEISLSLTAVIACSMLKPPFLCMHDWIKYWRCNVPPISFKICSWESSISPMSCSDSLLFCRVANNVHIVRMYVIISCWVLSDPAELFLSSFNNHKQSLFSYDALYYGRFRRSFYKAGVHCSQIRLKSLW